VRLEKADTMDSPKAARSIICENLSTKAKNKKGNND